MEMTPSDVISELIRESFFFLIFLLFFFSISLSYLVLLEGGFRFRLLSSLSYALLQIYISNLILSALSIKKMIPFVVINMIVALALVIYKKRLIHLSLLSHKSIYVKIIFVSVAIILAYVFMISFFFPSAGTDDIGYRLPVVFENIRTGSLFKMNQECDPRMAFPQTPYSIFEAYILISGSDRFIEFSNLVFLIISIVAVYSISRTLGGDKNLSLIASMFVPITPVFIGQLRSNYVDLAFASLLVASFAFQLEIVKNKRRDFCIPMSVYMGLLLGTKYTALIFLPGFEFSLILSHRIALGNLIAISIALPHYLINFVNLGFPIYPVPFSELGKRIYPQGENILNMYVFFQRYVRKFVAFLKYDNLELSYHKGFGIIFWCISLPAFIIFCLRRIKEKRIFLFFIFNVFAPLIYLLWSVIPTIHVQARFLMWFVILTYPFISFLKLRYPIILTFFLAQFVTNFLKMRNQDQPLIHPSPIFETIKEFPGCIMYDAFFLRYSVWFKHMWKLSTILQIISESSDEQLNIKCAYLSQDELTEGSCPFLFYGPIRRGKINNFSSCTNSVVEPNIIVVIGKYNNHIENFVLVLDETVEDPYGKVEIRKLFVRSDLYEKVKVSLDNKRDCFF